MDEFERSAVREGIARFAFHLAIVVGTSLLAFLALVAVGVLA